MIIKSFGAAKDPVKPQDVLLLLKISINSELSQVNLSRELSISQSEVSFGKRRLQNVGLLNLDNDISLEKTLEFLFYAVSYICPFELGPPVVGIPTVFSYKKFNNLFNAKNSEYYAWPHVSGKKRGTYVHPIHHSVADACLIDSDLYELCAALDMIRMGRARERDWATKFISKKLRELNED